jgi:RNA-binding protein
MLSIKTRNQLRALSHELKPVVSVGKRGHTETLVKEIDASLLAHELIKVQFQKVALDNSEEIANQLCKELAAELVEIRGHVATLYRAHPEKPRIKLTA